MERKVCAAGALFRLGAAVPAAQRQEFALQAAEAAGQITRDRLDRLRFCRGSAVAPQGRRNAIGWLQQHWRRQDIRCRLQFRKMGGNGGWSRGWNRGLYGRDFRLRVLQRNCRLARSDRLRLGLFRWRSGQRIAFRSWIGQPPLHPVCRAEDGLIGLRDFR